MDPSPRDAAVLLLHDGELDDVGALVRELLGADGFVERRGAARQEDQLVPWAVVVGTPRRLVDLQQAAGLSLAQAGTRRVAVLDKESRTLRSMLRRAGVELLVRRPVHPAALRLLLLHAFYRGPEKRRSPRVSVGAPVRFRSGLRSRGAILADLSLRGCRLITRHPVARGRSITVRIPGALGSGRTLSLRARVLRTTMAEDAEPGCEALAALFEPVPHASLPLLRKVIEVHASGPASLAGRSATAAERPTPPLGTRLQERPPLPPQQSASERRSSDRHVFDRRIIALTDEATRVVIGRDLSLGGMRIDPHDALRLGDRVRLAIHVRTREDPLVVEARVDRDDGEDGLLLRFQSLPDSGAAYLRRMLDLLPVLSTRLMEGEDDAGIIVSEILERSEGAPPRRASAKARAG